MYTHSENTLPFQIKEIFGIVLQNPYGRFKTIGWRYQGQTKILCKQCQANFEVFRKPYQTTQGNFEYWAIICIKCKKCFELNEFDSKTKRQLSKWSEEEGSRSLQILAYWEQAHKALNPEQRKRFLKHPTLTKLVFLDANLVKYAIESLRFMKLDEIFGYVYGKSLEVAIPRGSLQQKEEAKVNGGRKFPKKRTGGTFKGVERGRESLRKFGTVNPPPIKHPDLRSTSLYKCSICKKPVVGNSCACDGW